MHHGPEMSSVSLLIQPSSITPTLTPGRDEKKEKEKEKEEEGGAVNRLSYTLLMSPTVAPRSQSAHTHTNVTY